MAFPPTLDGAPVFGLAVKMATSLEPRRVQVNQYAGVNGSEAIDLGATGRSTIVRGRLFAAGSDASVLQLAQSLLESYCDGATHTLTDTKGVSWANVMMIEPPEWEPTWRADPTNGYSIGYAVRLFHLS